LKHRDRLTRGGLAEVAAVAAEEKLNATYLAALWNGLSDSVRRTSSPSKVGSDGLEVRRTPAEVEALTKQWQEKAAQIEAENQRRQSALQSAKKAIESQWASSKRVLAESKVAEGGSVPFEKKVSVQRGELLLLTVLPNDNHGADSTLIEWTIRETAGDQRTWSVADLVPNLLKGNPWLDKHEARWSFLETTSTPTFLTERRDRIADRPELKSWSLGSEPSVFVNSAAEPIKVWTTLPARSLFVHPGQKRNVAIAWTSPISGELLVAGRVADAHPTGGDGVSFELSHVAAADLGQALADLGNASAILPDAGLPPDMLAHVRMKWREATTDPAPVLAAIKAMQDQLFQGNYRKNAALAVGNGFPAWEDVRRVVARERVQGAAREPLFRMVALPAQPDTFVVWDRLRLEGGDGMPLIFAEHPELRAIIEQASGLKFGQHPEGRPVPKSALVTAAGAEVIIDLKKLPAELLKVLTLPRFLRADVIATDAVVINDVLAKHYGIPGVSGSQWRRVEKVSAYGRGGFLGFGAVIAKQSAAARTSPIKRGAWLLQVLGERLPNPPPGVPPLPETPPAGLTVREITERHRADSKCAGCHVRIDPFGMAMERFDAIGRLRPASELKPGDTKGILRDGTEIDDIAGLRNHFAGPHREDLLRTLARKLTGYALGRAVMTSDRKLLDEVTKTMTADGRWSDALLVIVQSEQFRCVRPNDKVAATAPP
jgi:hypothetical protein